MMRIKHVNVKSQDDGILIHRSAWISQIFVEYVEGYELQDRDMPVNKLQMFIWQITHTMNNKMQSKMITSLET
jgi:hypothetical protein